MDSQTFDKAVEYAQIFKRDHGEGTGAQVVAQMFAAQDAVTLQHNITVLIETPQNPFEAFNALNILAQSFLREHRAFPPALATWAADVLAGTLTRPAAGRQTTLYRDTAIQACITRMLVKLGPYGLKATRSSKEHKSACDAVADVWCMSYENVERLWLSRPAQWPSEKSHRTN